MEADSTTYDGVPKKILEQMFPFHTNPENLKVYQELTGCGEKFLERQLIERLQNFCLLPKSMKCPSDKPGCQLTCKPFRVKDRVQWSCEGCGKRLPIRTGSFFMGLQCSLLQALQMILAWCEDADCAATAEHYDIKPRVATMIYDKLDELAVKEQAKFLLGGENSVVLAEMYPDCLNRLSPDTTDQPHVHRILMLADTNHIPTAYKLHVIRDDLKKHSTNSLDSQSLAAEAERAARAAVRAGSLLAAGAAPLRAHAALHQLAQHVDADMQHFLNTRVWRQAVTICSASRDLCAGAGPGVPGAGAGRAGAGPACAAALQRYLDTALFRLRYGDGFFHHVLGLIAAEYTEGWRPADDES